MRSIFDAGGDTIAQDEESCAILGMPKEVSKLNAGRRILSLDEMITLLKSLPVERAEK